MSEATIFVFGTQGRPRQVEHLAAWLGEVFVWPDSYTRELGGHPALLRHHAKLAITAAQRERFVEIFLEAADAAGLPNDDRFRRRFREYIEWGSQIALAR
jgi:hemoglobin